MSKGIHKCEQGNKDISLGELEEYGDKFQKSDISVLITMIPSDVSALSLDIQTQMYTLAHSTVHGVYPHKSLWQLHISHKLFPSSSQMESLISISRQFSVDSPSEVLEIAA